MRSPLALLLLAIPLVGACGGDGGAGPADATAGDEGDLQQASKINGGSTGAMIRQTSPSGYTCIESTITLPDYSRRDDPTPWIYFGLDDEKTDVEAGYAFQQGTADQSTPRRYKAYLRRGTSSWFAGEADRVMPGATVTLQASLEGGKVVLEQDGKRLSLASSSGESIDGLSAGLDPKAVHVRRVVGLATSTMTYAGGELPRLGPVRFENTTVCSPSGKRVAFEGAAASWSRTANGVVSGTAFWPRKRVSLLPLGNGAEEATLFPFTSPVAPSGRLDLACEGLRYSCGGHDNGGDPTLLYQCNAAGQAAYPKKRCDKGCQASDAGDDSCR